jgi:hypothetical protein
MAIANLFLIAASLWFVTSIIDMRRRRASEAEDILDAEVEQVDGGGVTSDFLVVEWVSPGTTSGDIVVRSTRPPVVTETNEKRHGRSRTAIRKGHRRHCGFRVLAGQIAPGVHWRDIEIPVG